MTLEGTTIFDLDEYGKQLEDVSAGRKTEINIDDYFISDSSVKLHGTVLTTKDEKTFNLEGTLKKADYTDTLIVGNLVDTSGNYDVIFFGIDSAPNSNITLNYGQYNDNDILLKLYLLEKGTRDFTVIESAIDNSVLDLSEQFNNVSELNQGEYTDIFWFSKILAPIKSYESNPIATFALSSGVSDKTYSLSYSIGVGSVNEEIVVRTYVEGPTSISGDGLFTTKIYPLSTRTYSTQVPNVNSNTSNFEIGVSQDTVLEAYTDPGDVFRYQQWDGSWQNSSTINLGLSWSYSLPGTGLSFSPSYTNTTQYTSKTLKNFDNSGTNKVRQTKVQLSKNNIIKTPSHTFDVNFSIGHYSTKAQKKLNLKWTYYVWNAQNIYKIQQ